MENRIPASIQNDMLALTNLLNIEVWELMTESQKPVELISQGECEFGGLTVAFNSPSSLICIDGEYDHERFLRLTDHFRTESEHLANNIYILTTKVTFEGVEPAEFVAVYDFDNDKGLPLQMYQAYEYLRSNLSFPLDTMLELFGAITTEIALNHEGLFRTGLSDTMGDHFDVEKAIAHDLKIQHQSV
ncbi:hypothetical protein ETB66_10840 [Vibrio parahaemolyticus]|nr:hypothetical protein [Vibrio parahaemolyticus]